jgi:predicted CxxxxCH...CXXCH cytochrome family protein
MIPGKKRFYSLVLISLVLGGILIFLPSNATALLHNEQPDLENTCDDCHTTNVLLVEQNTSLIRAGVRSLPTMKTKNGNTPPSAFGCTFCHYNTGRSTYMRDSLDHFAGKPSQHPVDRGFSVDSNRNVTLSPSTNTTRWMSNWDNSWTRPGDQIGCVDCHDVTNPGYTSTSGVPGGYPNHISPDNALRTANPFMLRGGSSSWSPTDNHATNTFCANICHAGSAPGTSGYRMGHYGWGAFDNVSIKEPSGIALKSSKCVDCHETHYSSVKYNLMGERNEPARTSISQANNNVDPANCTNLCHDGTTFSSKGHGKAGINQQCANCHDSAVSHRDQTNPRRITGGVSPATATLTENLASNGRDDNYDGVIDDAAENAMTYSAESNCSSSCHGDKHVHQGTIGSTSGSASCLHCHDMHGNGIDNNIRMVRGTIMGKQTIYQSTADFFRSDNTTSRASVCDNPNCHAKPLGSTSTPGTILGDVQEHKDANVQVGTVCTSCHNHSSTTGGSSFAPVCNSCHTFPGQAVIGGTHSLSPVHDKHVASDNTGGYAFPCSTCHYKYTHNQSGVNNAGEWLSKFQSTNVNIKFDGSWNPPNGNGPRYAGVSADNTLADNVYAPGVGGTGTCAGLTCHGNSAAIASWPEGSNTTPAWNNASSGACGTCHKVLANDPPTTFAHATHADNTATGYGISCRKCHYQTTNDGSTIASRSAHLNHQSNVTFDTTDARVASGSYSGTATVGDSGSTTGTCSNIYCHSPGNRMAPPFDNGAGGVPDWTAGPLACNACHGASGQAGISVGMPAYANGSPKINSHQKHLADKFACQVCHWATTTTGNTITGRSNHGNGIYDVVNDNIARHAFSWSTPNCSAAVCHGGWNSGPNLAAWGQGPYGCDACHMNTGGVPAASDVDQFSWDNGMAKINADQWNGAINGSGHGRTTAYASGNPGAGTRFATCTSNCHTTLAGHDNAVNPFRLRTYSGLTDFSDTNKDPGAQQDDNLICLDCHSATGANPTKATRIVEQNHYGTWVQNKHTASTMGGTFCVDCHDPHGDANHYMIQDNVTQLSDGAYGKPVAVRPTTFSTVNLDGASGWDSVYDWGDYVKSAAPYTGICQTCHAASGGALYFNTGGSGYSATHNKSGSPPARCTSCHAHNGDFSPSCNSCHGEPSVASGAPPYSPFAGNRIWPSTVDNYAVPAGLGNHRSRPASGIDSSGHDPFTGSTGGCAECHTGTPGSGPTHNQVGNDNAVMNNIANHNWYTGAAAAWSGGPLAGAVAGGSVVDDSCSNINCHSPYYGAPANQYKSGTPVPYTRYWLNQTLWDCYTCHAYDGRTATSRPAGADNTMSTGMHSTHAGTLQYACSRCHDVTGYSATTWPNANANHKNGFVNWSFAGSPNRYGSTPAYSVGTGTQPPTDDNTTAGHRSWGYCSNLYCHSIGQTASGGSLTGLAGEYKTPYWDNALSGKCGTCHGGDGVTDNPGNWIASGSHTKHVNSSPYAIACSVCHSGLGRGAATHADNGVNLSFGTVGLVSLLPTVYSQGNAHVVGNGFGNCTVNYCHGTGTPALTGGANQAGAPNLPVWGTPNTALCGSCHGGPGGATNYPGKASNWPTSGSHARHMSDVIGPRIAACTDCHTANTDNTHVNGTVDLRTSRLDNTATTLALTQTCDPCHGSGVATAKANWATASSVDCLTCHGITPAYTYANATGRVAPNVAGDNATYGANAAGHNRPTGSGAYASGNPAANRTCGDCHDLASAHIDGTDNTTYSGNRLLDNVNGVTGITTVSGLCAACHTTSGSSPATKKSVNTHGNAGYAGRLEGSFTGLNCDQCHEPHGMVNVSTGSTGVNLWMINPTITVTTGVTVSPVRLFAKTGANSFNAYDPGSGNELNASLYNTNASDQLCVVCHASASNPGQPMTRNIAGRHNAPGYSGNEAGKDCSGCHSHNQDGNIATVDGLMPLACNACHSYPGVSGGTFTKSMSAVHAKHVGTPSGTSTSRQYDCTLCHFNYTHNQNGVTAGAAWPGTYYTLVDIRFDNTWNPGTPTYAGANAYSQAAPGNGGTGTCAGLYCHGGNASLNAGWGGSAASPKWDNTIAVTCGACHDTGTGDTTPGTRFATKNHPAHLDNAWGPGVSAFSAGGNCSEGTGCHPKYDLSPSTTHANNAKDLRSTAGDNGYVGATLATTQVCVNCHSTTASSQGTGDTLVRTQGNWDNASYKVPCVTCHNNGVQGWQNLNGTGDRAPNIDVSYYGNGHGASGIDNASTTTDSGLTDQVPPVRCETCHDETGAHIGTAKDGTNPWRLDGAATNYTQTGGLDHFCLTQCHSQTALPPRHARIVNGTWGVGKDNALHTHPTATESVGTSKDRWYQVNADASMPMGGTVASPLTGDLTTKSPAARTAGTLLACVTCHDPHGVGTAATPTRTFSGANTEAGSKKMLRYNYSGSGLGTTALCAKCHK